MADLSPEIQAHLEWLGFVQPTGLVVSAPALVRAGAILERNDQETQRRLRAAVEERTLDRRRGSEPIIPDFVQFARDVLGWSWSPRFYAGADVAPIPDDLRVVLPDYDETLAPDFAIAERDPAEGRVSWQLLVRVLPEGQDLDQPVTGPGRLELSSHARLERLLRRTGVPAGLLFNGRALRLLSAPHGESSGWLDFRVADMVQTAGRPIAAALRLLLSEPRLLSLPRGERLAALLASSRKFQNEVSIALSGQVLHALYELVRGFQAAHDAARRATVRTEADGLRQSVIAEALARDPDQVYRGLLTVLMRCVFLLYAEERDMLPRDEVFVRHYSLIGLYERLRADAALHPDTMDQRFGAWAQLLVLFRLVHDGAAAGDLRLPRRHGVLFDPNRFPFLEGRPVIGVRQVDERIEAPLVPDGTVLRALQKLLVLDGERLSYRALDVEQIGSVYETMMGFRLETATGRSVAIKASKPHGAPTTIDLDALLLLPKSDRIKRVEAQTDRKLSERVKKSVAEASTLDDLHAALQPVIDTAATPDLVPLGAMVLQPSAERRKSGSHYTPRELTEPIVRTTLAPILDQLVQAHASAGVGGDAHEVPRPGQILDLKVLDPAMGSGAFLVEACRQLGDTLVEAWRVHGGMPAVPADEDEVLFARRLIAQRCLYGVDRNPVAVDLAKVSLWLATLARDHALTFVDHALRHGDSLVGLTRAELEAFHWRGSEAGYPKTFESMKVAERVARVAELRARIRDAGDDVGDWVLRDLWDEARAELDQVRLYGDLVIAAYFDGEKPSEREAHLRTYAAAVVNGTASAHRAWLEERRQAQPALAPFHWELEFPEVFDGADSGFDLIVGNPPFQGGRNVSAAQGEVYASWLRQLHPESSGGADLSAHFFRRAFDLIRSRGAFGLIATNTIAQGDTRSSGLRWICTHGGTIYAAQKRLQWPGLAAVVVSVVYVIRGQFCGQPLLDGRAVERITAFLFHCGTHDDPEKLLANACKSFQGSIVLGMGFTFDDTDTSGVATPLAEMQRLLELRPSNREVIFPYVGGEEVNSSSTHTHHRFVIDFGERSEAECRERWPDLMAIVEAKVKPERTRKDARKYPRMVHEWWKHWNARSELRHALVGLERVLVTPRTSTQLSFVWLPTRLVYSENLVVIASSQANMFTVLQSRVHEVWVRFTSSTLGDAMGYRPTDCFETFPFPAEWECDGAVEVAGQEYYDLRATIMVCRDEGLTKTSNRFHDPDEHDLETERLRALHAAMDRAVLDAYGWTDLQPNCEFLLDYEIDEDSWSERKKRPYRYRWPDEVRDEVLARLLELNAARHAAEVRAGMHVSKKKVTKKRTGRRSPPLDPNDASSAPASSGPSSPKKKTPRKPTTPLDEGGLFA